MDGGRATWKAELGLSFAFTDGRSVLAERRHHGPLVVQKALYPEGLDICHAIIVHAPGGIAGGDDLGLDVRVGRGARVLLTTPSATKWYKSEGRPASQSIHCAVDGDGILEWLPLETILFESADASMHTNIDLDEKAVFAGWEITCLGRRASGESFRQGRLRQRLSIRRNGKKIWGEWVGLQGDDRVLQSKAGLNGRHVFGSMVVAAGAAPKELVEACRAVVARDGEGGVTALPDIVSARYLGSSAERAKDYFEALRSVLRPWYADRPAQRPRLWDT